MTFIITSIGFTRARDRKCEGQHGRAATFPSLRLFANVVAKISMEVFANVFTKGVWAPDKEIPDPAASPNPAILGSSPIGNLYYKNGIISTWPERRRGVESEH